MSGLDRVQTWKKLTPEVRDALDAYLEHRQTKLLVGGVSTLLAILALLGGFLAWVVTDLRTRAELQATAAAEKKFAMQWEEFVQPQLQTLRDTIKVLQGGSQKALQEVKRLEFISIKSAKEIEKWTGQARKILGELADIDKIMTLSTTLGDIREAVHRNRADLDMLRQPVAKTTRDPIRADELFGQTKP